MEIYKLMDKIEEIQDTANRENKGSNEAELQVREDVVDLMQNHMTDESRLVHELFVNKVAKEIGTIRTIELLAEAMSSFSAKNQGNNCNKIPLIQTDVQ